MAKFCTNCGKELDEKASLCLNCGVLVGNANNNQNKEKKKGLPTWTIVLIIVGCVFLLPIIILVIFFIFAFNTINKIIENPDINMWTDGESIIEEGTIGDTLISGDFKITLIDALIYNRVGTDESTMDVPDEGKEYLVFFFDVQNISDEIQYISDFDFTGYVDGYEIEVEYLYNDIDGIGDLDATLKSNKKTKGYVAFEVEETWETFEIRYSDWFDDRELVFKVLNEDNSGFQGA